MRRAILWFRRDLRLSDHPALAAAADASAVLAVFVLDDRLCRPSGAARIVFLSGCLRALDADLDHGLAVYAGDPVKVIPRLAKEFEADVYVSADFGPYGLERDRAVNEALGRQDRVLHRCGTPYAVAPGTLKTNQGQPFKVYSPFYRAWADRGWPVPIDRPADLRLVPRPTSTALSKLLPEDPTVDAQLPPPGEAAAHEQLDRFLDRVSRYADERDLPAVDSTSRLSPYLKYGCLHPRQILARLARSKGEDTFRKELAWREFYADVLLARPDSARRPLQPALAGLKVDTGKRTDERFAAWAEGRTGYPIVDAGMRQLRAEAWMHNRVRMTVASFLVKDLHLDWTRGARHFMRSLVDGDLASNQHGWQWTAGTGTDPAPSFRVFNPILQGRKFDPDGDYVRRYIPELAKVDGPAVHEPWTLPGGPPAGYPPPSSTTPPNDRRRSPATPP